MHISPRRFLYKRFVVWQALLLHPRVNPAYFGWLVSPTTSLMVCLGSLFWSPRCSHQKILPVSRFHHLFGMIQYYSCHAFSVRRSLCCDVNRFLRRSAHFRRNSLFNSYRVGRESTICSCVFPSGSYLLCI